MHNPSVFFPYCSKYYIIFPEGIKESADTFFVVLLEHSWEIRIFHFSQIEKKRQEILDEVEDKCKKADNHSRLEGSPPRQYLHFEPDNTLWQESILHIIGCLVASLVSIQ